MKRRALLEAMPLALLLPSGILQAAESAFPPVPDSNLTPNPKNTNLETEDAMPASTTDATPDSAVVYELRIYHASPGKLDALVARFRDHTMRIFANHGMKSVAYWTALDEPAKSSTFFYILEHPSRDAATSNWKSFQDDPEWKSVKEKSEVNGKLAEKIDSTFLTLTDFSPRVG